MKRLLRQIIPPLRRALGHLAAMRRSRRLGRLAVADAFDEVYRKAYWRQGDSLSGVGSEGSWAADYCAIVADRVGSLGLMTAVDAGCGDFSIGVRLAQQFERYTALDISAFVIERNRGAHGHLQNVTFAVQDLIEAPIPMADLVMVRQVFQHLTNTQILAILNNIARSGARFALIAEEVPAGPFEPNRDLTSHSVTTRLNVESGIDITAAPFNRSASLLARLRRRPVGRSDEPVLSLHLMKLQPGGACA